MRILLVEPNLEIANALETTLRFENFNVFSTDMAEDAIDLGKLYDYDCIVLDLNLPDLSGFEVIRALRLDKCPTPILVLTASASIEDKVRALSLGADDYMTKPFHRDELVARIVAVVRRARGLSEPMISVGPLTIDIGRKKATVNGETMHLTGKEYLMLEILGLRKGSTITKDMFLSHLYGGMDEPELKIIDVFICKLRKKLAVAAPGLVFIETVWGRGYTLADTPVSTHTEAVAA